MQGSYLFVRGAVQNSLRSRNALELDTELRTPESAPDVHH